MLSCNVFSWLSCSWEKALNNWKKCQAKPTAALLFQMHFIPCTMLHHAANTSPWRPSVLYIELEVKANLADYSPGLLASREFCLYMQRLLPSFGRAISLFHVLTVLGVLQQFSVIKIKSISDNFSSQGAGSQAPTKPVWVTCHSNA